MPRIFDNIAQKLLPALQETLQVAERADFCVGYFNLRGWKQLDAYIEQWQGGDGHCCRLLVGMQRLPHDELHENLSLIKKDGAIDNQTAICIRRRLAEEFREQLSTGIPTNDDERCLRRLASQIKDKKVIVKLFLRHPLHAKLYLLFRPDPINPTVGYLGSSNLTFAGLSQQGELNLDVLDHDACNKLAKWFEDRWLDKWCVDISQDLVAVIEESWAREDLVPPYYIYIKMAYHLAQEARTGLAEFRIPRDFGNRLFEYQTAAVKIAAHHLNKRGGVLLGDVVGLGKTLMASALARIFEDDYGLETLILCPKNLVPMWEDHVHRYRMRARVLSISLAQNALSELRRYRLLVIDESHNLRNREGRRYRAIHEYIQANDCRCILLSATPYNKNYIDLSSQLRLFVPDDKDIGIRPERYLRDVGETEFIRRHQCSVKSLAAFEKSAYPDDWRDLMRLYLVRRTRSFIQHNYAETDPANGRKYLTFEDGSRSYFPVRRPKTLKFKVDEKSPDDQYGRLYVDEIVDAINNLKLPRYGLGNYVAERPHHPPSPSEARVLQDLSRAGKRLMGFCRTNLFKRLESSGTAFVQSVERHILRNYIYLHAIENDKPLPIGTLDRAALDTGIADSDENLINNADDSDTGDGPDETKIHENLRTESDFRKRAAEVYGLYENQYNRSFKWLRASFFLKELSADIRNDSKALTKILKTCGKWDAGKDTKLNALHSLITKKHPDRKILVFTQFADTVDYLEAELKKRGVPQLEGVTGDAANPTETAWRFSPESNEKSAIIKPVDELRVVIATDVLSEGQNLQDCSIIVNYDLPWAIIRLIQRAGRVDRIGQKAEDILCYSFLPAHGVERIIRLRSRVRARLHENAEVVGTDEAFFEDDNDERTILDLYHEKAGILDGEGEGDVDLASYAYQIWKNAVFEHKELEKIIPALQPVTYSARMHVPKEKEPAGVLLYMRTAEGNDALARVDDAGNSVTESQFAVLRAAECTADTPAVARDDRHHALVRKGVEHIVEEERSPGGQLGRPSGARFRTYERLKRFADEVKGTLFESQELHTAIEDIYRYPLRPAAVDTLNRQLKAGISDDALAKLALALKDEGRLSIIHEEEQVQEPRIICSLGLVSE